MRRQALVSFDAYAKAAAAFVSVAFALLVWSGGRRRAPNLFLAGFLLLLGANQAAEAARAIVSDPASGVRWARLAAVFASVDPLFLYAFVATHVRRGGLDRPAAYVAVATGCALLAVLAIPLRPATLYATAYENALGIFTSVVYLAAWSPFLRGKVEGPEGRLLLVGLALAAFPRAVVVASGAPLDLLRSPLFPPRLGFAETFAPSGPWAHVLGALAFFAALVLAILLVRRLPSDRRRAGWIALAAAGSATLAAGTLLTILQASGLVSTPPEALVVLGRASAPIRWLAFGALLSVALLRYQLLGLSLRAREVGARIVVAIAFAAAAAVLLALLQVGLSGTTASLRALDVVILAAVAFASQSFRRLVGGVAKVVYGVPGPGDRAGALEAYRMALAQARAEGRASDDPELARLRGSLGLTPAEAQVIERAAASPAGPLAAGDVVAARYHVLRLLGRGAGGRVYLGRDALMEREVVLKEIEGADGEAAIREARAAGAVQHPNVVQVHDVVRGRSGGIIVAERVEGGSLAERLERGPLPRDEAIRIMDDVLAGLAAVHARGIVHRDLKPANILLGRDGAKIGDFGVARVRSGETLHERADAVVGTPGFMSPEQRAGRLATARSDVYAAGLVARAILPRGSLAAADDAIARALAEDPRDRWPSASAFREALREAARVTRGT